MPNLAALRAKSARLEVPYAGETIVVFYRPGLVTDATQTILRQLALDGDFAPLHAELRRILIAWDLTDDEVPLTFTAAGFVAAGIGIVGSVTNAIVRDVGNPTWVASPPIATPSSNGSSPTASSEPHPTTTTSSSPPNGPTSHPGTWPDSPRHEVASAGSPGFPASGGP